MLALLALLACSSPKDADPCGDDGALADCLEPTQTAEYYAEISSMYFDTMDYTVDHLGLDPSLRGNVTQAYYQAGHMMYLRLEDLAKLTEDVRAFYASQMR